MARTGEAEHVGSAGCDHCSNYCYNQLQQQTYFYSVALTMQVEAVTTEEIIHIDNHDVHDDNKLISAAVVATVAAIVAETISATIAPRMNCFTMYASNLVVD